MSTNTNRRPSASAETFITVLTIIVVITSSLLLFLTGPEKVAEETRVIKRSEATSSSLEFPCADSISEIKIFEEKNVPLITARQEIASINSVNPPLPQLDISPQQFTVNAATGQIIKSARNSIISIPPSAFVDRHGNIVSGNVQVKYREFYNYMDIFLSGIPMSYDSAGSLQQLESAGMMELTASKGDEPLYVNQERKINVMLASMNKSPDFNLYYFDQKQNKWIYKGQDKVTTSTRGAEGWKLREDKIDSVERVFRYTFPNYNVRLYSMMEPAPKRKFFLSKKPAPYQFTFRFIHSRTSIPELYDLRTITWSYTGMDAETVYLSLFGTGTDANYVKILPRPWKNITIHHEKEDDSYLLTVFDDGDTARAKIVPRLRTEGAIKRFNTRMHVFLAAQEQRMSDANAAFVKFQNDTASYFASNSRFEKTNWTGDFYVMRQFQVDGFGIWNCDRPVEMPKSTTVIASFEDQNGNPLQPIRVFLADKSFNTVYSYDRFTLHQFKFNPSAQNLVWVLFPGNLMAVIKPKEFSEKYSESRTRCIFKVNIDVNAVVSKEDLKDQLAFDL